MSWVIDNGMLLQLKNILMYSFEMGAQSLKKLMGQSKEIKQNWTRAKNFEI